MNLPRGGGSNWVKNVGCSLKLFQLEVFYWLISFLETIFFYSFMDCCENTEKIFPDENFSFQKKGKGKCPIEVKLHFEMFDVLFHYFMTE